MTPGQWIAGGYAVVFREGRVWLAQAGNVWTRPMDGWEAAENLAEWDVVQDAGHLVGWVGPHPRDVMLHGVHVRVPAMLVMRRICQCTAEFHCISCRGEGVYAAPLRLGGE